MARLFGTDGARGIANTQLTSEIAFRLGQAAVTCLGPMVTLGKDTRLSGDMLESAVAAGVMSAGGTVLSLGIIPTPAIALLTDRLKADAGIVISASHNPPEYNGIKFFDAHGFKLPIEVEHSIETYVLDGGLAVDDRPDGAHVGTMVPVDDACEMYIDHAVSMVKDAGLSFEGIKVALDTAHGASSFTTAEALRRLGASVTVINDDFDGCDINVDCGSTHLDAIRDLVAKIGADIGIAHDGDADRVLFVDGDGQEIDGDMVIAACAVDLKQRDALPHDTVVSTIMCNLGLVRAMQHQGITVVQTPVGDRNVLSEMRRCGYVIGGEQSGHTIFLQHNSTGDGLVTACQLLSVCVRNKKTVTEAVSVMRRFPQELINVKVVDKSMLASSDAIAQSIDQAEHRLGDDGRVLVRASGTEPLIRVMVEAQDDATALKEAQGIASVVKQEMGQTETVSAS